MLLCYFGVVIQQVSQVKILLGNIAIWLLKCKLTGLYGVARVILWSESLKFL